MLRRIIASIAIGSVLLGWPLAQAQAGEAGRVVLVEGDVRVAGNSVTVGSPIHEGDQLQTGAQGHLYIKTIDNGFFILRPASTGRIVSYKIDAESPANTRIKLEVNEGVARQISGEAVKKARQNFRLNTPVAAIGVRGTDFTVFTTNDTTRVAVQSGGVVVSPLSGTCNGAGYGPCEGVFSREISASQIGLVLQVTRGQKSPELLRGSTLSPNSISPPRHDEPRSGEVSNKDGTKTSIDLDLAPVKSGSIDNFLVVPTPLLVVPTPATEPATKIPEVKPLVWGRWQYVLGKGKEIDVTSLLQSHELIATNAYYALMRSRDGTWQRPEQSTMGFSLQSAQAAILNEVTRSIFLAGVENGVLQLDFAKSAFSTQFDLVSQSERFKLQSQGYVTADGKLDGNNQFMRPTNMAVHGVLNTDNASAAYLFQSRLDDRRVASGVTYWTR